ncbi:MAG: energy-coupling factor transport system ATP-binding protein [Candidatus Atribacteria bacterium]|nr:energy-coupling factor transport system ATP-binding protein [Candidatus Atribacteria bacterium]
MIEFKRVSFWYTEEDTLLEKGSEVLQNLNLIFPKGEFVVILGRNGSGKSTLAKHFNGLLLPKRGEVLVEGMSTQDENHLWDIRQKVGLVFQNPDNQIIATTVEEDVAFGPENLGLPPAEIRQRVDQALEMVDMMDYKGKEPHLLSGGQKQRVAIAGVLAMSPEYLVLDEATSMLDPEGREELMGVLLKLKEVVTIVHITHHVEESILADRLMIMDGGEIVIDSSPREFFASSPEIEKWGLELPQIPEIAWRLKKKKPELFKDRFPLQIEELVEALCLL